MNPRRVAAFVDALLSDRRPKAFKAGAIDAEVLRAAIAMRSGRPGEVSPDERFVARLRDELAMQARGAAGSRSRSSVTMRARLMLGAAAVTVMGGTVAATTTMDHLLAAGGPALSTQSRLLRVGTFRSTDGHTVGQLVAYRGNPSWVFMSIRDPGISGTFRCRVQMANGRTAATGTFVVRNGVGEFARTTSANIGRFRGATLVAPGGVVMARARFVR